MTSNIWEVNEDGVYKQLFKEFKKTKQDLDDDIIIMRKWANTQLHFPEKPSYQVLRFFILFNKFSIEKAKQKLDMYYNIRSLMPEFCKSTPLSPEMVLHSKVVYCIPLPKTTTDFKRVMYWQINPNFGPEFLKHENVLEYMINLVELIIQYDICYNCHYIFDCNGVRLSHLPKFNPMVLRKSLIVLEKVYSNRIASVWIVNFPSYLETVVNTIIKPMLKPKIRDRITIESGTDRLLHTLGKAILPKDIGGEERSLAELNDCILNKFKENEERFEVLRSLKVDESVRPQKLVNDEILGYYGNFKKINVD